MLSAGQLLQKFGVRGKTEIGEGKNMKIESIVRRKQPGRKMQGIAAALLPFEANGRVAVEAFQNHLGATHRAGLMNAVNMDTGYVNFLSEEEKRDVLRWAREALGAGVPFVAGAYIECQDRSEEHTSELQSHSDLVCRLLLEKKKKKHTE